MRSKSFVGEHERSIDAKNRLSIPSEYRTLELAEHEPVVFYLVPGPRNGTVSMYTEESFAKHEEEIGSELLPDEDELTFMQMFYAQATRLEVDKQGRVLMPEVVLKRHGIGRDVVITGAKDRLDVWNKSDYESFWEKNGHRLAEIQRLARQAKNRRNQTES
jgi:MraZ protein